MKIIKWFAFIIAVVSFLLEIWFNFGMSGNFGRMAIQGFLFVGIFIVFVIADDMVN